MRLVAFKVSQYRNIIDSGWVDVSQVTALVGQNECGKSNLLQALFRLNAFDNSQYELDADWPIDEWATKDPDHPVCVAEFELTLDEIRALYESASSADQQPETEADHDTASQLPTSLTVSVARTYRNKLAVTLPDSTADMLKVDAAANWVLGHLPKCVYMSDYATFAGHTDLNNLAQRLGPQQQGYSKLTDPEKTIVIALDLAAINIQDLTTKGGTEPGRTLRGFDTNAASLHLTRQFKHKWKQKAVKFHIRIDGPTLDIHVEDQGLEAFVPLERRSRGFQWFVSFVWRFTHASKGEFAGCILLLDEPGIHLHHAGHADLLGFLEELAGTNTVVYTTHLATMLDTGYPERVKIMEVQDHHATVRNSIVSPQKEPMMVIETALGLSGDMSGLLGNRQNLVVEGVDEVIILQKMSGVLRESGEPGLSDRIYLVPAHGASKTIMYAGFMVGNQFDAGVLLDSDAAGEEAKHKISEQYFKDLAEANATRFRVLLLGDVLPVEQNEVSIEDIFSPEFYLECANEAYGTNITLADLPTGGSAQICRRVERVLVQRGRTDKLDKRRVLKVIQKRFNQMKTKNDLPTGTYSKARALIDKLNQVFETAT